MNFPFSKKLTSLSTGVLSLLAFGFAFQLSFQQDQTRVSEIGQLAWAHLHYAQELKDDMAVIDWSKGLEKLDNVRAFQVLVDSKTLTQGGNRNFLSPNNPQGVSYRFPSDWNFRQQSPNGSPVLDFVLVYHSWPGPLLWGLVAFFSSLVTGLLLQIFSQALDRQAKTKSPKPLGETPPLSRTVKPPTAPAVLPPTPKTNAPSLYIDKNFVIQLATNGAASLLQKNPDRLLKCHLLDLAPDPLLIQAMEKSEETKIQNPFFGLTVPSALLKPEGEGFWLVMETLPVVGSPQKP